MNYFAFAEYVERDAWKTRVRFDLVPVDEVGQLAGLPPESQDEFLLFGTDHSPVITVVARGNDKARLDAAVGGKMREDQWIRLSLGAGPQSFAGKRYAAPSDSDGEDIAVRGIEAVSENEERLLRFLFGTRPGDELSSQQVATFLQATGLDGLNDLGVGIYNVGQGSAGALVDDLNVPIAYFDLGGGCFWNARTYPAGSRRTWCWERDPPVILSHFDFDHLYSAELDARSRRVPWLVPSGQGFGKRVGRLLADVRRRGRLMTWAGPGPVQVGPITLCRPTPHETSKNNSGIVVRVDLPTAEGGLWSALFPADAGYSYIRHGAPALLNRLDALVAAHHGSGRYTATPPTGNGTVVYSAGHNNTYKHPKQTALVNHKTAGWGRRLDTQTHPVLKPGNIVLSPQGAVPMANGCKCTPQCDLAPRYV